MIDPFYQSPYINLLDKSIATCQNAVMIQAGISLTSRRTANSTIDITFVVLLGALTMLPPLSIDISLPGLPVIAQALHAQGGTIQWTLSAFVLAFGGGQLVLGPLSDRYGRRPVLLCGLGVFTLLAVGCAVVSNVYLLVALRFAQGLTRAR